jgi:hypothetical protein
MSAAAVNGLRECIAEILGGAHGALPEATGDELTFWRQWLAQRNLGLVPVAAADSFAWPGYWFAVVEGEAVLMYGSPSGPVRPEDPAGPIAAGFVVAPLDLRLDASAPYGAAPGAGVVAALLVAPGAEAPLVRVETVTAIAGRGLEGDRYARGAGTFSGSAGTGYELTLVAAETLEGVLSWEDARRNVVTRGIDLNALVGRDFTIGAVTCRAQRLAEPCAHLERLTRPGIMRPLVHRAGIRADIVRGGTIHVGDAVASRT